MDSHQNIPSQWGPVAAEEHARAEMAGRLEGIAVEESETSLLKKTGTAISGRVEGAAKYLQDLDLSEATGRLEAMVRRYPVQTLLIGAAIGFLLGRGRI
jgi:ElaB/YqjD/DUF883 family membrane-anchored ribosome-binding protein